MKPALRLKDPHLSKAKMLKENYTLLTINKRNLRNTHLEGSPDTYQIWVDLWGVGAYSSSYSSAVSTLSAGRSCTHDSRSGFGQSRLLCSLRTDTFSRKTCARGALFPTARLKIISVEGVLKTEIVGNADHARLP